MRFNTFFIFLLLFLSNSCQKKGADPRSHGFVYRPVVNPEKVIKVLGKEYLADEVFADIKAKIYQKEIEIYELKMKNIKVKLLESFMGNDPRKKGLTNDEYLEKYILPKKGPSQKEIDDFIKEKKIPMGQMNDELRKRVKAFLSVDYKKREIDKWIDKQSKDNLVEIYLEKPDRPHFNVNVWSDDPYWGKKDAAVEIVVFSDFQCPFCKHGAQRLKQIKEKFGKKVKIIFKQFPLPFHKQAKSAALASLCAHQQGQSKFWKIHDYMFTNQDKLAVDQLKLAANKKIGLNLQKFQKCLDSNEKAVQMSRDITDGKLAFVESAPTFFINGKLILGARPFKEFEEEILNSLKKAK